MRNMQIKKALVAGALGALMAGSTVAFAATSLSDYPKPFVDGSSVNTLVVVGATAKTSDVVGAVDLAARLGGATVTRETVSCPGSTTVGSVSGEGKAINTANEQIYLGNSLKKTGLRTALSDTDLPVLLKSGSVTDSDAGTTYEYDQFIDFPNAINLAFTRLTGKTPNMDEPTYLFDLDTTASTTSSFYRSRVVFNDEVNLTSVAGEDITLFGKLYTFSSESVNGASPKVVLLGSSVTKTMGEGETATITIDGVQYDVKLLTVGSTTSVGVQVGSDSKSIAKGATATVGGLDVYVDDIFFSSKEGTVSSASLFLGARKIILSEGTNVKTKIGSESEKVVDGTFVDLALTAADSTGKLTTLDVYTQAQSSNRDFLAVGGTFQDTVWKSFSLSFPSISTPLGSELRDKVEILPSGTKDVALTLTTDRGYKQTVKFANLNTSGSLNLADQDADKIVVVEGDEIDKNQYFVIDSGDFSRMFEITSVSSLGTADGSLTLRDVFSGATLEVKLGATNATTKVIDGQTYYFNATGALSTTDLNLRVRWGDGSGQTSAGSYITVWPTLLTKNRARLALTTPVTLTGLGNGTALQLPTGAVNLSAVTTNTVTLAPVNTERADSTVLINASGSSVATLTIGNASEARSVVFGLGKTTGGVRWYSLDTAATTGTVTVRPAKGQSNAVTGQTNSTAPGVLLVEEQDDDSNVNSVLVDIGTETSSGDNRTIANSPSFSSNSQGTGTLTKDSNTDVSYNADFWGTVSVRDVADQDKVTLWYPDDQVSASVYVLSEGATIGGTSTSGGTSVEKWTVHPIKTPLAKLDNEVTSADKATKHLILVGGPVVNTLVADLAASGKTKNTDVYRSKGAGYYLIQAVDDAFASGKVALVVAGYEAAETRMATSKLQAYDTAGLTGSSWESK